MKRKLGAKPLLYPMPVLIIGTYNDDGTPNAMTAAWGGITEEKEITVCISDDHKTAKNLTARGAFTVSIADCDNLAAADYVGIVSGNDTPNKVEIAGWHAEKCDTGDAPLFKELPLTLECRVKSYDENACRLVGEIMDICADEEILDANGKIDLSKFHPITYDSASHTYRKIGDVVGEAFKAGRVLEK